ncbi:MAG: hypothetical protein GC205_00975 [Bacteroidetes bacterium]|nr:hypothetical protein [Bacteroidota bacterium]
MRKPLQRFPFFIRLFNWEYWPFNLVYLPVFAYYGFLALRARSPLFFTAANPGIPTGGLVGESKRDILAMLPPAMKPATVFIPAEFAPDQCLAAAAQGNISFPMVAKPDIGERGMLVRILDSSLELERFRREHPVDFLLQEYIAFEEEVSVLHFRFPGQEKGTISSVTLKEYLQVTGDGRRSVAELVAAYPRARLQENSLRQSHAAVWNRVLAPGQLLQFHTIGNHSKGCKFMDGRHKISEPLHRTFDQISSHLDGVYYCRYDIKCASWQALEQGRDFKILEINGVKSEPAHIYDPGYPILRFYRDILWHWGIIYRISLANKRQGVPYMRAAEGIRRLRTLLAYHKKAAVQSLVPVGIGLFMLAACTGNTVYEGRASGSLRDGKRHGSWTGLHFNGNPEWEGTYVNGVPNGPWTTWYPEGGVFETYTYRDSLRQGPYRALHPDGSLLETGAYDRGKKTGNWERFYADGTLQHIAEYRADHKEGLELSYYSNGRKESQTRWTGDSGEGVAFHPNGEIRFTGQWKEGKQHGLWKHYNEQGRLEREEFYRLGELLSAN